MEFQDKSIHCAGCDKDFLHTVADQQAFAQRGFNFEPKKCPDCRKARKEKAGKRQKGYTGPGGIGPVGGSSGGWGGRGGGGGGGFDRPERRFSGGFGEGGGGGGFGGPRPSFDAVCATCGQKTTVPFEPTQGRDVYCRDCFRKRNEQR